MSNDFSIVVLILVHLGFLTAVIIQADRRLFFAYVAFSLATCILLFFTHPWLAVLKIILWVISARYFVEVYNHIINLNQNAELALHDVASSLVRREAVVPRIEGYVSRYSNYEATTLINTIRQRGGHGRNVFAVVEQYPNLRASEQFRQLASELVLAEESILAARFKFNEAVAAYNRYLRQFPTLLFARAMAFRERDYITA